MTKIHSINSNELYLAQNAEVSLKLAGNTAQVTFTAGNNRKCPIKNLSKDEFVDLSTGEVKKRQHSKNRFQSPKSVRKSINSLMDLIRCNATNPANCKWITLTYREEMTDCKRVFKDNKDGMDKEVLKCLAYIHMNNIEQAVKIAASSINDGNRGNYENGGKAFFEWILML